MTAVASSALAAPEPAGPSRRPRGQRAASASRHLTGVSTLGLGVAVLWFSLLVLIPLAAVVASSAAGGLDGFWQVLTNDATAAALRLTVGTALLTTALNIVMGTVIA